MNRTYPQEVEALVKGLRKAVAKPETEWIDANIVRLLLDRFDAPKAAESNDCHTCSHDLGHCCRHDGDCAEVHGN